MDSHWLDVPRVGGGTSKPHVSESDRFTVRARSRYSGVRSAIITAYTYVEFLHRSSSGWQGELLELHSRGPFVDAHTEPQLRLRRIGTLVPGSDELVYILWVKTAMTLRTIDSPAYWQSTWIRYSSSRPSFMVKS